MYPLIPCHMHCRRSRGNFGFLIFSEILQMAGMYSIGMNHPLPVCGLKKPQKGSYRSLHKGACRTLKVPMFTETKSWDHHLYLQPVMKEAWQLPLCPLLKMICLAVMLDRQLWHDPEQVGELESLFLNVAVTCIRVVGASITLSLYSISVAKYVQTEPCLDATAVCTAA